MLIINIIIIIIIISSSSSSSINYYIMIISIIRITRTTSTNGAAAKVINLDMLGNKFMPWHFWRDKSRSTRVPKKSLCQKNTKFAVTPLVLTPFVKVHYLFALPPLVLTPFCPFPSRRAAALAARAGSRGSRASAPEGGQT